MLRFDRAQEKLEDLKFHYLAKVRIWGFLNLNDEMGKKPIGFTDSGGKEVDFMVDLCPFTNFCKDLGWSGLID